MAKESTRTAEAIVAPKGDVFDVQFDRQVVRTYENGDVHPISAHPLSFIVGDKPLPGGPRTITTYAELLTILTVDCADEIEAEAKVRAVERQRSELVNVAQRGPTEEEVADRVAKARARDEASRVSEEAAAIVEAAVNARIL